MYTYICVYRCFSTNTLEKLMDTLPRLDLAHPEPLIYARPPYGATECLGVPL